MNVYVYKDAERKGEKVHKTRDVGNGVYLDFDKDGELLGVEIIEATRVDGDGIELT